MTDGEEMVAFRLAPADRSAIQRLIDQGEFRNRSDFFRYAVKTALRDHLAPKPPLDLEMEGVELPDGRSPTMRGANRSQRNKRGMSR